INRCSDFITTLRRHCSHYLSDSTSPGSRNHHARKGNSWRQHAPPTSRVNFYERWICKHSSGDKRSGEEQKSKHDELHSLGPTKNPWAGAADSDHRRGRLHWHKPGSSAAFVKAAGHAV